MSLPTLKQVQAAVNQLDIAVGNIGSSHEQQVPALTSGSAMTIILAALGYDVNPSDKFPPVHTWNQFLHDYAPQHFVSLDAPISSLGSPLINSILYGVAQQALSDVAGGVAGATGPMHSRSHSPGSSGGSSSARNNPPYSGPDKTYTVVSGDTLSAIADALGMDWHTLAAENPQISDPNAIYAGDIIGIPGTAGLGAPGGGMGTGAKVGIAAGLGLAALVVAKMRHH